MFNILKKVDFATIRDALKGDFAGGVSKSGNQSLFQRDAAGMVVEGFFRP
jgi:hypothetical protein